MVQRSFTQGKVSHEKVSQQKFSLPECEDIQV